MHISIFLHEALLTFCSRSAAEQEQNLQSHTHRQAISDVEDDSVSLRVSLRSQDTSVASTLSSRRSNLSDLVFDFENEINNTGSSDAEESQSLLSVAEAITSLEPSNINTLSEKQAEPSGAEVLAEPDDTLQTRFKKVLARRSRLSLPFQGILQNRSSFLPILKVSKDITQTYTYKNYEQASTTNILLYGMALVIFRFVVSRVRWPCKPACSLYWA